MYAEGFNQVLYKEYICWIQVKIHISDQTSLRICNSVLHDDGFCNSCTQNGFCTCKLSFHEKLFSSLQMKYVVYKLEVVEKASWDQAKKVNKFGL